MPCPICITKAILTIITPLSSSIAIKKLQKNKKNSNNKSQINKKPSQKKNKS